MGVRESLDIICWFSCEIHSYVHKSERLDVVFSLAADELWVLRRPDDPLLRIRTMDLFCAAEGPSKSLLRCEEMAFFLFLKTVSLFFSLAASSPSSETVLALCA